MVAWTPLPYLKLGSSSSAKDDEYLVSCSNTYSIGTHNESEQADSIFCLHESNYDGFTVSNLESYRNFISSSIESKLLSYLL